MGAPEFQVRPLLKKYDIEVFSSNYELYGDMSHRVMQAVSSLVDGLEQYSIDECFVRLAPAHIPHALDIAQNIRRRVQKWTGITVSIGVAQTKTLAKLANHIAKKNTSGVFFLDGTEKQRYSKKFLSVKSGEWGVIRCQSWNDLPYTPYMI